MIDCDKLPACKEQALPQVVSVYDITGEPRSTFHFPPRLILTNCELEINYTFIEDVGYPILIIHF